MRIKDMITQHEMSTENKIKALFQLRSTEQPAPGKKGNVVLLVPLFNEKLLSLTYFAKQEGDN